MQKSRSLPIVALIVIALIAVTGFWMKGVYNTMVTQDEQVKTAWGQVENQYQRRAELSPNLVNTVKGDAAHERDTLEAVIQARALATQTRVNADNLEQAPLQLIQAARRQAHRALSRPLAARQPYPDS